jgi:hypothetical protein
LTPRKETKAKELYDFIENNLVKNILLELSVGNWVLLIHRKKMCGFYLEDIIYFKKIKRDCLTMHKNAIWEVCFLFYNPILFEKTLSFIIYLDLFKKVFV